MSVSFYQNIRTALNHADQAAQSGETGASAIAYALAAHAEALGELAEAIREAAHPVPAASLRHGEDVGVPESGGRQ